MYDNRTNLPPRESGRVPVWWTPKQIAETLQVTTRTVARWISSGELHVHRFGRAVRVSDANFRAFVDKCQAS